MNPYKSIKKTQNINNNIMAFGELNYFSFIKMPHSCKGAITPSNYLLPMNQLLESKKTSEKPVTTFAKGQKNRLAKMVADYHQIDLSADRVNPKQQFIYI